MLESKFSSKVQFLSESKPKNVGRSRNFSIQDPLIFYFINLMNKFTAQDFFRIEKIELEPFLMNFYKNTIF